MPYFLSPVANDQQCNANGAPLVGGKVFTYLAGSTTPAATYTDSTSGTQQANPIILNSLGLPASPIWMNGGVALKFVIQDASNVTIRTFDNVVGINDTAQSVSEWVDSALVPTYISATQFSVPGDQTALLQVNRRLRNKVTAGFAYGRISASVFSAGVTTVTMVNDSTPLDAGLSAVAYGFLSFSPSSVPYALYASAGANSDITALLNPTGIRLPTRVDVASAATVVLTGTPDDIRITGTTAITAFTVAAGEVVRVTFGGSLTLTNNANIITQTGANIVTQAGDTCFLRATAANTVEVLSYVPAFLNQQTTRSMVELDGANGYGSTNTMIPRFTTVVANQGTDITYADSATLGASFTINTAGTYAITYTRDAAAAARGGISRNSSQLTTAVNSITTSTCLTQSFLEGSNRSVGCGWAGYLAAGAVIRPHADAVAFGALKNGFTISRLS